MTGSVVDFPLNTRMRRVVVLSKQYVNAYKTSRVYGGLDAFRFLATLPKTLQPLVKDLAERTLRNEN